MNLQDWLDKYYPKEPSEKMTKRQAIEHSLRKWEGLFPSILRKHGLKRAGSVIREIERGTFVLQIDSGSCALCIKYYGKKHDPDKLESCAACPLAKHLGNPCDENDEGNSPYQIWITAGNPRPMIKALKALLEDK